MMKSVLGSLTRSTMRAGAQCYGSRGIHSSFPLLPSVQLGEYSIRRAQPEDWEEIFAFRFKNLHRGEPPHSELYIDEESKFQYKLCEPQKFILLVALKNSARYMQEQKELNEKAYHVSKQKRSWFTAERKKMLGIVDKPFVTQDMEKVLGTLGLYVGLNVPDEFGISPVDPKWCSDGLNDAYVEPLVGEVVRRHHVGTELFQFAKKGAMLMGVKNLFMQVEDAPGLKYAASVGFKVIPTVPTLPKSKKILVGQELRFR